MLKKVVLKFIFLSGSLLCKDFPVISLAQIIRERPDTKYQLCLDAYRMKFEPFPFSVWSEFQPHEPLFEPTYIVRIPQGQVYSAKGFVVVNNLIIDDFVWSNISLREQMRRFNVRTLKNPTKVEGRVAMITQDGWYCYFHWLTEVLGRLILLEDAGVEYDWLYVTNHFSFMRELLELWGVDAQKIIQPLGKDKYIEADELIVPSLVATVSPRIVRPLASYVQPWVVERIREKLLPFASLNPDGKEKEKRIFISRKDAHMRRVLNEDEVFALFEPLGFKRYDLSFLSVQQQMRLFHGADIVVASHGAGLANLLFARPGTRVIEFFQARGDATYWYLSQMLGMKHTCIKTAEFLQAGCMKDTVVPLECFDEILQELSLDVA